MQPLLPTTRLLTAGLLLAACAPIPPAEENTQPPNIVLVLVDDLGWTDLSCQGSKFYRTPNIDKLAAGGTRFTNAYAACAVCSPTRAAVMTGRYPARVGVTDWIRARFQRGGIGTPEQNPTEYVGDPRKRLLCPPNPYWMEHSEVTIAEVLRKNGYRTCHIGKWHLGDEAWYPTAQGFDENYGGCDYGQPPSYFDPYKNRRLTGIPNLPPRRKGEYLTDREADEATAFIRRNKDQPFFLFLANYAVHTPIQAKKVVTDRYAKKQQAQDPSIQQKNAKYAAMVESVDDAIGKVLGELDTQGIRENTLVLFTSDNGGLLGPTDNAPLRSGKGFPYEGGIRVPLIANWPGRVRAGHVTDRPACSIDLFPTITEVTNAQRDTKIALDGVSLTSELLADTPAEAGLTDRGLLWHFPHYRGAVHPYSILRQGDWKLIKRYEGPTFELYNLADDLAESKNLAAAKPALVEVMDAALTQHLSVLRAKLPRPNPDFGKPIYSRKVHPDNVGKPRVLLLGDSISMGYTKHVQKLLHGKAAVFRPMHGPKRPENCEGTLKGVQKIDEWLRNEGGNWDVIHFNFGLHDLKRVHPKTRRNSTNPKHPYQSAPKAYESQLRAIVKKLQATGAKLIYATTTPVPKGVRPYRGVDDPVQYNAIAARVMQENRIPINDLFAFVTPKLGTWQNPKDVHFKPAGSRALGDEVGRQIQALLPKK